MMSGKRKLLLDTMGLGKTAQAIVAFNNLRAKKVVIVCPSATKWQWHDEIHRWSYREYKVQVLEGMKCFLDPDADIVICPYSLTSSPMIRMQLTSVKWSIMVADEIHWCKNMKAARTKFVLKDLLACSIYAWGLTGTIMTNTPIDLFPVMASMGKRYIEPYDKFIKFIYRYCKAYRGKWGLDYSGSSNIDDLNRRLFSGFALRREKHQVLRELPSRQYRIVPVEGRKFEDQLSWDDRLKNIDWGKGSLGLDAGVTAEIRKELGDAKVNLVVDYVLNIMDELDKVVVFTWHRTVTEAVQAKLLDCGASAVKYYGGMNTTEKQEAKDQFITGNARVFVANVASAGTGLDGLQKVSSHCVFAEIPWTYADIAQATDRLWRMGQSGEVLSDLIIMRGSIEDVVFKRVLKKEKDFNELHLTSG